MERKKGGGVSSSSSPPQSPRKETYKPIWLGGSRDWHHDLYKSFQSRDAENLCKLKLAVALDEMDNNLVLPVSIKDDNDKDGSAVVGEEGERGRGEEQQHTILRDPSSEAEDHDPNEFWLIRSGFKTVRRYNNDGIKDKNKSKKKRKEEREKNKNKREGQRFDAAVQGGGDGGGELRGFCAATSLYGWDYIKQQRQGSPFADFYALSYQPVDDDDVSIEAFVGIADGAGWGDEASRAAEIAIKSSLMHVKHALKEKQCTGRGVEGKREGA